MSTAKASKPNAHADNLPFGALLDPASGIWPGLAAQNARYALSGIDAIENAFRFWRGLADASVSTLRNQQDLVIDIARTQLSNIARNTSVERPPTTEATDFFAPMQAAARAYERVGEVVMEAQRGAFEAMSSSTHTSHLSQN